MRPIVSMTLAACAVIAIGSSALAQTPPPATPPAPPAAGGTPDLMPFDIPYGVSIGLEKAKQVMAAAENEAKRRNWKMNIAVVDTNGELVHFSRMEGAQIASVPISIGKARTAARFRRESRVFYNAYETGHAYCRHARSRAGRQPRRLPAARSRQAGRRHRLQWRHRRPGRRDLQDGRGFDEAVRTNFVPDAVRHSYAAAEPGPSRTRNVGPGSAVQREECCTASGTRAFAQRQIRWTAMQPDL